MWRGVDVKWLANPCRTREGSVCSGRGKFLTPARKFADKPTPGKFGVAKDDKGETMCLVRAKLGNKSISSLVASKDVARFQSSLATMMKGNMDALKKVEKKKKEKKLAQ